MFVLYDLGSLLLVSAIGLFALGLTIWQTSKGSVDAINEVIKKCVSEILGIMRSDPYDYADGTWDTWTLRLININAKKEIVILMWFNSLKVVLSCSSFLFFLILFLRWNQGQQEVDTAPHIPDPLQIAAIEEIHGLIDAAAEVVAEDEMEEDQAIAAGSSREDSAADNRQASSSSEPAGKVLRCGGGQDAINDRTQRLQNGDAPTASPLAAAPSTSAPSPPSLLLTVVDMGTFQMVDVKPVIVPCPDEDKDQGRDADDDDDDDEIDLETQHNYPLVRVALALQRIQVTPPSL